MPAPNAIAHDGRDESRTNHPGRDFPASGSSSSKGPSPHPHRASVSAAFPHPPEIPTNPNTAVASRDAPGPAILGSPVPARETGSPTHPPSARNQEGENSPAQLRPSPAWNGGSEWPRKTPRLSPNRLSRCGGRCPREVDTRSEERDTHPARK